MKNGCLCGYKQRQHTSNNSWHTGQPRFLAGPHPAHSQQLVHKQRPRTSNYSWHTGQPRFQQSHILRIVGSWYLVRGKISHAHAHYTHMRAHARARTHTHTHTHTHAHIRARARALTRVKHTRNTRGDYRPKRLDEANSLSTIFGDNFIIDSRPNSCYTCKSENAIAINNLLKICVGRENLL